MQRTFLFTGSVVLLVVGCAGIGTREDPEGGAVITVDAGETSLPHIGAIICHSKDIRREGANGFEVWVHAKRLEGDNCAWVTFKCPNGTEGPETKVCVGDPPANTGCTTVDGKPVKIEVNSTFHK